MKKKIAIIAGGDSSEALVSMRSSAEVFEALDRELFEPTIVVIKGTDWHTESGEKVDKNDFSYTSNGVKTTFDYALIMIHGTPGENGILQGYFELMQIPYSSCNTEVSALTFNKSLCKKVIANVSNINLSQEITIRRNDPQQNPEEYVNKLGLPFFIKPNASGSSFGVTKVKAINQIPAAIEAAAAESLLVLMEEYIEGVEVSQGIMIINGTEFVLPITELVSKNEFFDYEAKYTDGLTEEITPARISEETANLVGQISLDIYKTLGCHGIVRIDYIIRQGKPYFIEVNTVPGMSRNSIVPQQWRQIGISMKEAYTMIINNVR